jgi:CHAD domain-containing protein
MATITTHPAAKTAKRDAPSAGAFLEQTLAQRWKAFGKRLRRALPRRRTRIDEAVHDLRTASRKMLSVLDAVEPSGPRKAVKRLGRRVHDVLDRLGTVRDLTVQRERLAHVAVDRPTGALRAFERGWDRQFARSVRKLRRRLARVDAKALRDDVRRIRRRLRDPRTSEGLRGGVVDAVGRAFSELQERRVAVDPTALETVHRMRISLKQFRYLVQSAAPLVPGASTRALDTLHELQTTMGDLHDLEVLSASLAAFAKGDAERTEQLSPVLADLEAQHSGLLRSFLRSADAALARWKSAVVASPARRRA